MRKRYSFSSRRTRKIENIRKQRKKYPSIAEQIIEMSDIILEVLDARFIEETRNKELEEKIKDKNKKLIYIFNKADLTKQNKLKGFNYLNPSISVSCKERKGIKELRNLIKKESKKVERKTDEKISVGIIGYPNTGKSSLINILIGKSSAGTGSDAGFTKNIQKLRLSEDIILLDSPGVISESEYSSIDQEKISQQTKLGGRSHSQVREPEMAVAKIMKDHPNILEEYYKINAEGDSEILIEKLGMKKGLMKKGGEINEDKVARVILKDWQTGKIKL